MTSTTLAKKDIVTLEGKRIEIRYHESAVAGTIIDSAKEVETGRTYDIDTNQLPQVIEQLSGRS